jgi:outer membrane protein
LVARAFEVNPLLKQSDAQVSAARHRASAARGERLPTISVNGGYNRGLQENDYGALWNLNPRNFGFNFGVNVSLPIFSGFQTFEDVARADGEARRADEQLRLTMLQVEQGVRSALIDVQSASEGLRIQQRSTALARQRFELAREQFRMGSIQFTNLQQIIADAANQERALVNTRYNFANAVVNLEEQVGESVARPE